MSFALNEVEATANKAARGAGMAWGIAEEAGKATRWLASRGLPGPELLLALLERNDNRPYEDMAPATTSGVWTAGAGPLCPLITGTALSDRANLLNEESLVELDRTSFPLLLAPFLEYWARQSGMPIDLSWSGAALTVSPEGGFWTECSGDALLVDSVDSVRCALSTVRDENWTYSRAIRCSVASSVWTRLEHYAHRTYAPATEESRERGAGSDTIDDE